VVGDATYLALAARLAGEGQLADLLSLHHDPAKSERADGAPKALALRSGNRDSRAAAFPEARQGHRRITIAVGRGELVRLEMLLPPAVAAMLGGR
jgi:hypothetical protein